MYDVVLPTIYLPYLITRFYIFILTLHSYTISLKRWFLPQLRQFVFCVFNKSKCVFIPTSTLTDAVEMA